MSGRPVWLDALETCKITDLGDYETAEIEGIIGASRVTWEDEGNSDGFGTD
ncbi:hypothetical protein FRB93_013587 [Tulasnella sp. JGI-2019a]|nr:hypothetical protein FRB93_013587 [Tulasnella sp. JGI-2019a]